tara:strand:+ start:245 stop:1957 length:1713 start_codon:yes stop_codon:yes gene_type:complete
LTSKKFYTLGICNNETSSACLFKNGTLIAAASEERFSRIKMDSSFPYKSIEYLLEHEKIKLSNIKNIAYAFSKGFNKKLNSIYKARKLECRKNKNAYKIFTDRYKWEETSDKIKSDEFRVWSHKFLNKNQIKLTKTFYHHEAHAASATLLSMYDKGLVLTADGRGDYESLTLSIFDRKKKDPLTKIYSATSSDSLGYFYGRITGLLGFKPKEHEGKVTGLAAYGNPKKTISLMRKMIKVKQGRLIANLGDYYRPYFDPYSKKILSEIRKYSKEDIAAAAQLHLEECLCDILNFYAKKLKIKSTNLMLAGGIFANVKVNQSIKSLKFINKIFVQPQMGDGGLCLGAGALSLHQKSIKVESIKNMYLGPSIKIKNIIHLKSKNKNLNFKKCKSIQSNMCRDLTNNKVLGLVRGRMEFGPRALCNRSIIYKTKDKSINDWLNKRMNRTEFMPFAPIVRSEVAKNVFKDFIDDDFSLRFMTSTINCTKKFSKKSPAVTHIDGTARPQVIYKNENNFIWLLLKKWENLSKELSLVNTSFNAHQEPIINNESEALNALKKGMIDVLYIENFRITKI